MLVKLSGWVECDFYTYKNVSSKYGYSAESSPEYIKFMLDNGVKSRFLAYKKKGQYVGAACLDNGWLLNDFKNNNKSIWGLPLPVSGIVLPMKSGVSCLAPFKSRCLSDKSGIVNSSVRLSKRVEAIAKNKSDFSKKTQQTRRREINKFIAEGGSFIDISTIPADKLFVEYDMLLKKRWGVGVENYELNKKFFSKFHDRFFGDVAILNGEIVGIQLLIKTDSVKGTFVDFINIGYDTEISHPIGTMLMWRNIERVDSIECSKYSYGFMSGDYKRRWCKPSTLARIIF